MAHSENSPVREVYTCVYAHQKNRASVKMMYLKVLEEEQYKSKACIRKHIIRRRVEMNKTKDKNII